MNQLDRLYRALIDYRKQTVGNYDCDRQREAIANADAQDDVVELERKICTVETDWIEAIEKGLVYIEKAIREERQFIRTNGEVVPIEKVKRVDKESVVHLARHSNLLKKEPKNGEDIIPDELYTVERLSDFAVYENRFLYMLLCYLRDFITLRYDKILELTTTYNGKLFLNKTVNYKRQKIKFEVNLTEQRKNDPYLKEHNEAKDSIERIDLILRAVIHYLGTPLMEEVGKTPMLKPPITKTNVLKMNQNFKGCVALYDYVTAYHKAGYTVEEEHKKINPLPEVMSDEFAEATSLFSFLTYEHSMGLEKHLRERYQEEEARRKIEEGERLREQIKNLKKRIKESGMEPEEYMLLLEKRNRALENDSAQLVLAKQEIERLNTEVTSLTETVHTLEGEVQSLKEEMIELCKRHEKEIAELKELHEREIAELTERHEREIAELTERYENEIAELNERYTQELTQQKERYEEEICTIKEEYEHTVFELTEKYTQQLEALKQRNEEDRAAFEKTIQGTREAYAKKEQELYVALAAKEAEWGETVRLSEQKAADAEEIREKESEERRLAEARLNAMRMEYGLITNEEEFTSEVSFDELERQYHMLKKLFKQEWAKVKKKLRSRIIWTLFRRGNSVDAAEENIPAVEEDAEENNVCVEESAEENTPVVEKNTTDEQ